MPGMHLATAGHRLNPTPIKALQWLLWPSPRPLVGWQASTRANGEAGKRANKLRSEPEFREPPSDGHQTGLVVTALRAAGVPKHDTRIQGGIAWLLKNQRASGRWWTRSLNTDEWHFITYSGTCYALLALASCDAIPHPAP